MATKTGELPAEPTLIELESVSKLFPGVVALDDVSIKFTRGRVHALLGENGAGKSTLIKIIDGIYKPDKGRIKHRDSVVNANSPQEAASRGVSVVHQHRTLAGNLSVAENLLLGQMGKEWNRFSRSAAEDRARKLLSQMSLDVDPWALVDTLSPATQQMVEVARAIGRAAELIIFDEPTTSLTPPEREVLFGQIRELRQRGIAIVYISHDLEDAIALSDEVTVLRDGRAVAHFEGTVEVDTVIQHMIGRRLESAYPRKRSPSAEVVLKATNLRTDALAGVDLEVHRGEIVCLAGLVGAGRTEVLRALYGVDRIHSGRIQVRGTDYIPKNPRRAISRGIGLVPEDRKEQGLVLPLSVSINAVLGSEAKYGRGGMTSATREAHIVSRSVADLRIKTPSPTTPVEHLSGGNQQKVVLARWLARHVDLLLVDEPTVGIDVGARGEFYRLLDDFAAGGGACLVVSSDLTEVLGLADRIVVVRGGRSVGTLTGDDMNSETTMRAMTVGVAA